MLKTKKLCALVLCIVLILNLVGCSGGKQTLAELLEKDPSALEILHHSGASINCSDYTVSYMGGIDDSIDATRYSSGLVETTDRFVNFKYIVKDNKTGWKYIFEDYQDIPKWLHKA